MIKHSLYLLIFFVLVTTHCTGQQGTAVVNQYQGIYIFSDCKPSGEYKYLGTVKGGSTGGALGVSSNQYEAMRDRIIKRVKKEYPDADGVILDLKDGGKDKADAIKFK